MVTMATSTENTRDRSLEKVDSQPAMEKPVDIQNEFEAQRDLDDDEHTKKLTRKLLFKLDTR